MDMSKAALPPIHPSVSAKEKAHPRYHQYRAYVGSMSRLLVTAMSFSQWLRDVEQDEYELAFGYEKVYQVKPGAQLQQGWYKNKFAPITRHMTRFGPFETQKEAEAS